MNSLWVRHACVEGKTYLCAAAQLRLWLKRNSQGWLVAARHVTESLFEELHATDSEPDPSEWQRFVTPSETPDVQLVPVLPDRPVVSRPEARIEIAPRHTGRFYVTIPVWLRVQVGLPAPVTLCEFPTHVLSKTWFGHPAEEGEIGYALTTRARQEVAELTDVEGRAICPISLENNTHETLAFAQLLLSVRHMSVYQTADGKLWTNECRLGYTSHVLPASLAFGRTAPEPAKASRLVSGPREAPASGLTARVIASAIFKSQF